MALPLFPVQFGRRNSLLNVSFVAASRQGRDHGIEPMALPPFFRNGWREVGVTSQQAHQRSSLPLFTKCFKKVDTCHCITTSTATCELRIKPTAHHYPAPWLMGAGRSNTTGTPTNL